MASRAGGGGGTTGVGTAAAGGGAGGMADGGTGACCGATDGGAAPKAGPGRESAVGRMLTASVMTRLITPTVKIAAIALPTSTNGLPARCPYAEACA